jgi:hypothetical protein
MQIKFLDLYHNFGDTEYSKVQAQDSLLYMWQRSLQLRNIKFISSARVEFKDYSFFDYPDQEKAKREIQNAYGHKRKKKDGGGFEYYWCGTQYPDLETIYAALAEQKRFMELTITTEDN